MRLRALVVASIAVVGLGLASEAAPVRAETKVQQVRHCVMDVTAPKAPIACYGSFTAAIAKATGGRITDAPNDANAAVSDARLLARLKAIRAQAIGPIGTFYASTGYRGRTLTITGDHDCDDAHSPVEFSVEYVGDRWNDDIESFKAWRNCGAKVFEHRGFRGVTLDGYYIRMSNLGSLNNEVSSIEFT